MSSRTPCTLKAKREPPLREDMKSKIIGNNLATIAKTAEKTSESRETLIFILENNKSTSFFKTLFLLKFFNNLKAILPKASEFLFNACEKS